LRWQSKKLQIQGARILCHSANAVPEGCVLIVRRNDNEMKRNAEVGLFTKPSGNSPETNAQNNRLNQYEKDFREYRRTKGQPDPQD